MGRQGDLERGRLREVFQRPHHRPVRNRHLEGATVPGIMNSFLSEHQAALPPFRPDYRSSGVLMHVTSLPSPYGIGDLGPAAFEWVDRLHDAGQGWWQALPLGPTGCGNSPYSCLSSFAGNSLLVSPDLLIEDGLLSPTDCKPGRYLPKSAVDFDTIIAFKHRLLDQAWRNFDSSAHQALQA